MMGASALSSACGLTPPSSVPTNRDGNSEKIPGGFSFSEHDSSDPVPKPATRARYRDITRGKEGHRRPRGDGNAGGRVCGCGTASAGPSGRVSSADPPLREDRAFAILYLRGLSKQNLGKKLGGCELVSRASNPSGERVVTELDPSERKAERNAFADSGVHRNPGIRPANRWDADPEGVRANGDGNWRKRRAALAAVAASGALLSLSLSSPASADPLSLDFLAPLEGRVRTEPEGEVPVQWDELGITNCGASAPPLQSPDGSGVPVEAEKLAVPLAVAVPKGTANKVVAASVAVAVAGSVAEAASAAGRVVASSGGSAVATSLTVLHSGGAFPGSSLLARAVQHFGGGGVAGAVGATVVYPLDTIKTRMQAQSLEGEEPQYKDEIDCFKQLVANEGPGSLYHGLVPQLLGIAPEKAMKLTVNEVLLEMLETTMPGARIWALEFIAGGGGGFSQVVFTNPMEIVKVRLQTQPKGGAPKSMWDIVKELGVGGLYEGAGVTMARDVPSSAIFFACYTLLRQLYPEQSFLAGCVAAVPATVLVTPMDIIKTRLQREPAAGEAPCTDWWQCLQQIVQKEGPHALFKGSVVRVLRTSPQFGITLMIYGILCNGGAS